jgi:hypothetical protein
MQDIITSVYLWIAEFGYKLIKIACVNDHKFMESFFYDEKYNSRIVRQNEKENRIIVIFGIWYLV